MSAVDPHDVTKALNNEGLNFEPNEDAGIWSLSFEIDGVVQRALLILPDEGQGEYFIAASVIKSPALEVPLEKVSTKVLRTIIRVQTQVLLAKFTASPIPDGGTLYAAVSPCSKSQWTGEKLQRRLIACARLAVRIQLELEDKPQSSSVGSV